LIFKVFGSNFDMHRVLKILHLNHRVALVDIRDFSSSCMQNILLYFSVNHASPTTAPLYAVPKVCLNVLHYLLVSYEHSLFDCFTSVMTIIRTVFSKTLMVFCLLQEQRL